MGSPTKLDKRTTVLYDSQWCNNELESSTRETKNPRGNEIFPYLVQGNPSMMVMVQRYKIPLGISSRIQVLKSIERDMI